MTTPPSPEWNPAGKDVLEDPLATYDRLREEQGVAFSELLQWSVFRHEEVLQLLLDHERASSVVSARMAVPNGMDPPQHTVYRRLIDDFFTPEQVEAFRPRCAQIAAELLQGLRGQAELDLAVAFALPYATRIQCAFMGWPLQLEPTLTRWIRDHHRASLAQDRVALGVLGEEFESLVSEMLTERRVRAAAASTDVTARLMHLQVDGRPLADEEIASIVRNWSVGEIGTIAAAVGIVAEWLSRHPAIEMRLRHEPGLRGEAIDEILRLHGPLSANRRVAGCPLELSGRQLPAGARLTLHWPAANRDPRVFEAADEFRWGRDPQDNLLYGAGIHVCPGAGLARMELQVALDALLAACSALHGVEQDPPQLAHFPAMGFSRLPLRLEWS